MLLWEYGNNSYYGNNIERECVLIIYFTIFVFKLKQAFSNKFLREYKYHIMLNINIYENVIIHSRKHLFLSI